MSSTSMEDVTPPGPEESTTLALISLISNRLVSGAAPVLRKFADLSVNETRIVMFIHSGAVSTAAEAVRLIGIDKAAVSRSVQRLIERGFLVSERDENHGNRNLLMLTAEGAAYARAFWRYTIERENRLLSVLSAAERSFLKGILSRVIDNVTAANSVQPDPNWLDEESLPVVE